MTSVLVAGIKNMIIVQTVLAVKGLIVLVWDLKQLSCNTDRIHSFYDLFLYGAPNFTFFKLYLNTLKKP